MCTPLETTPILRLFFGTKIASMKFALRSLRTAAALLLMCSPCLAQKPPSTKPVPKPSAKAAPVPTQLQAKQLETLSRALKAKNPTRAYAQLSVLASQKSSGVLGARAALALGYYDFGKSNYPLAAKWFERAKSDPVLADYAFYWAAETNLVLGHDADALAELKQFRTQFPDSIMTDQALQSLGEAAIASNQPAEAVDALNSYAATSQRPALLFLRAQAREKAGQPLDAVADYQSVYMRFATSEQGREADKRLEFLRSSLGGKFPALPLDQRFAHAGILFAAKNWRDARDEYAAILHDLSGDDRERAELRILECGLSLGAGPSQVAALQIKDPDVDAERFAALADFYRGQRQETDMATAVEAAFSRAPSSQWTEAALFLAGNYYWVQLDRDRAAGYYKRVEEGFPTSADAAAAQWRFAWTAVLQRKPEGAELLQEHLRRFPGSSYTSDALYWLGRLAEEVGVPQLARSYYAKLDERYPNNYFAGIAAVRLRSLGAGPVQVSDVIAKVPPVTPPPKLDGEISPAAAVRQARADALRSIAFDASAELELRAGYAATGEPRLLLEAAQEAVAAGHYGAAIVTIRQVYPQLDAQPFSAVPRDVWLAAYALPYEDSIRRWSTRQGLDPMLVAGLIHQESAFESQARSNKNAIGLMQLLPGTARTLARTQKIGYSQARLTDPDYNLRLGTVYFAGLEKQLGSVEAALAAYNAGEDRVALWTAGPSYREQAEFVDSIPFTETRQYVEIIARNAEIYRRLYGEQNEPRTARTNGGH
jgi:soluble lytic murein transglycosylase